MENPAISRTLRHFTRQCLRLTRRYGQKRHVYSAIPMPETYWAITVARAAPTTPRPRPSTNQRSSTMFNTAETARKISGARELPTARSREAK